MLYSLGGYAQYPVASLVPAASNSFAIAALAGGFVTAGRAAALNVAEAAAFGSYSLVGATTMFATSFPGAVRGFVVASVSASITVAESAGTGSHLLTGRAASFGAGFSAMAMGAYNVGNLPAPLVVSLGGLGSSYSVAGYPSVYSRGFEDWFPRPFDADDWTDSAAPGGSWTANAAQPESWIATPAPAAAWTPATEQSEPWSRE